MQAELSNLPLSNQSVDPTSKTGRRSVLLHDLDSRHCVVLLDRERFFLFFSGYLSLKLRGCVEVVVTFELLIVGITLPLLKHRNSRRRDVVDDLLRNPWDRWRLFIDRTPEGLDFTVV